MKKLLAILLTLILAFSCFGALGTTAMAEEAVAQSGDYTVLLQADLSKPLYNQNQSSSASNNWIDFVSSSPITFGNTSYGDDDADGQYDYFNIPGGSRLYSPIVNLTPGKKYEITYKMRLPVALGDYSFEYEKNEDGTLVLDANGKATLVKADSPTIEIMNFPTKKANGTFANNTVVGNGKHYAYKGSNRDDFVGTWQIEGYDPFEKLGYSAFNYQVAYGVLGVPASSLGNLKFDPSEAEAIDQLALDLNDVFSEWKTVSLQFEALASDSNAGEQSVTVAFGTTTSTRGFQIKDFEVREVLRTSTERTVFESVLTKDGNMTAFDGSNKNQDSEYVTFANEEENDYIELRSQPQNTETGLPVSTAVTTAPFNVFPGNEYEISYKLRIPTTSATYIYNETTSLAPEWSIYQVDTTKIQDHKPGNRGTGGTNSNLYATGDTDPKRRQGFSIDYSYDFSQSINGSRTNYSFLNYQKANELFEGYNVTELFAGEWVTVTLKFTALASSTNSGAELCALSLNHTSDITLEGTLFQIKDVTVKETYFNGKATPLYTAEAGYVLDSEDFERGATVGDVAKFYGGDYMTEISWAANGSSVVTEGDNSFMQAYAHSNSIFLPLDKSRLVARKNFTVSFDWMFKNTGADFELLTVQIVGYNDGVYNYEGTDYPCVTDVKALAQFTPGEFNLDEWNNATLKFIINANYVDYNHYGVLIKYTANTTETVTEFTAENSSIYIDNFTLAGCDELLAGDYDNDGEVSLQDLAKLAQYFAGWSSAKLYVDSTLADYSGDGARNLYDLVKFAQDLANP
ncbi:MAG: hypothetical protein IJO49_02615 [Clostridia bacterium]|nr:hypothetical protein [Clostridia bacterium]